MTAVETFPPGEYLRDELDERDWTIKEFAEIVGRPVQAVSEIVNGRKQITSETAIALGEALGTTAEFWLNLQRNYDLAVARSRRPSSDDAVARRRKLRECVPVAELRARGWLPKTDDIDELERSVADLLDVLNIDQQPRFALAARRSNIDATFTPQQIAWIARLRQLASGRSTPPYDQLKLENLVKGLARKIHSPTDLEQLGGWFADCGVILITLLPLKGSKLDGVSTLLDDGTPVIGLTSRWDRMDSFLFTLLHECAHLLLGHLQGGGALIDEDITSSSDAGESGPEAEANASASAWMFPERLIVSGGRPSIQTVLQLAGRHQVHPSLVIGQVQRAHEDWQYLRGSIPKVRPHVEVLN